MSKRKISKRKISKRKVSKREVDVNDAPSDEALKACLDYIYEEVMNAGHRLAAHLIGVAAEAIDIKIDERHPNRSGEAKSRGATRSGKKAAV